MPGSLTEFDTRWSNKLGCHYIIPTAKIFGYLCSHTIQELEGNLLLQLVWRRIILRLRNMDDFFWNESMLVRTKRNSVGLVWTEDVQVQVISLSVFLFAWKQITQEGMWVIGCKKRLALLLCGVSVNVKPEYGLCFFLDYKEGCFMINLFMNPCLGVRLEGATASASHLRADGAAAVTSLSLFNFCYPEPPCTMSQPAGRGCYAICSLCPPWNVLEWRWRGRGLRETHGNMQ